MAIQSSGIGSGLDVNGLITRLIQVESQPLTTLARREASYQSKLSAYGSLKSGLASFQNSLSSLKTASSFQTLTATSSDTSIISASTNSIASAGTYNINVTAVAQAQSISSAGQVSSTAAIGTGASTTLNFQFGTITGTAVNGVYPPTASFAQDATIASGTVTIDATNNSLQGIRDAINAANIGVSASIVGDGSATPYHLVLASTKTGANSSLKITAAGDPALESLLNYNPAGVQNFTEVSTAKNAALTVNGIAISSASNTLNSTLQGVTLNVSKIGTSTLTVAASTTGIQASINNFVKAYNDLNTSIKNLTAYDPNTKQGGLLLGDATTQNIQNQVRNSLGSAVNGLGGGLTNLSQIGITFQRDGSLAADSTKLSDALTNNLKGVSGLFAAIGRASDSLVSVAGSNSATKGGSYALEISQIATQGALIGDTPIGATTSIGPGATLNVTLDGVNAAVSLAEGINYTPSQLAALLQSSINGTAAFSSIGASATVSVDGSNRLTLRSAKFGGSSNVSIADGNGTTASTFTGTVTNGTPGQNVAGTFNGLSAIGDGQVLTGGTGTSVEGLRVLVTGGSIGQRGNVDFSRGYADRLSTLLDGFIGTAGSIASTTDGVNRSITDIGRQRTALNARLADAEARYRAQFTALDRTISGLNNISTFLTQNLASLTGTNKV